MAAHLPALLVVVPLGLGLLLPLVTLRWPRLQAPLTVAGAWITALLALGGVGLVLAAGPQRYHVGGWAPPWGIELVLDPLSAFMAAVVAGVAACALLYGAGLGDPRLQGRAGSAGALSLLLLSALMGIVVTGDLFNLFVFLEVASLATYGLIAAGDGRGLLAALRYVILGSLGASLYLLGVGYLYLLTGTLNMADLAARLTGAGESRLLPVGVALMVVGLGIKMGLFPLHGWLPDAYTHAPPAVAALLAPVATKVAAYALARVLYVVVGAEWVQAGSLLGPALAWAGAVSVLAGGLLAIRQTDLRRLLAYSSVSQIGYIVLGLGVGTPSALAGAYLHVLHHALMKACLFFVAGAVAPAGAARVTVGDLRHLSRRMPLVTVALGVAAASMIGVPPAGGFFSKWYLLLGALEAGRWGLAVVILLGGLLAAVYMVRILEAACLVPREAAASAAHARPRVRRGEPGPAVLLPLLALAVAVIAAGLASARIVDGMLAPILGAGRP